MRSAAGTMMIRKAYQHVQKKQKRTYRGIVAVVAVVALAAGGYAYYGHRQLARQQAVALDLFYTMKSLDMDIANVERRLAASGGTQGQDLVKSYQERRRQMEINYDRFISGLKLYDHALTPQETVDPARDAGVRRMRNRRATRVSGRSRQLHPDAGRRPAVTRRRCKRAREMGYARTIAEEFEKQDLPPQFFYLAMVESGFNEVASGPPTRMGIAKGMWQFVPDTAKTLRPHRRTACRVPAARCRATIGTDGRRRRARPRPTSRTSIPPTRRPRACW